MNDIRSYVVMAVGAVLAMLSPIMDFIFAMLLLLWLNFIFGLVAARLNGEKWDWKKAGMCFIFAAVFFVIVVSIFVIGKWLHCDDRAVSAVQYVCWATTYFFGTNILRNWRNILKPDSTWYKLVDFLYYILSAKFIEDIPYFKSYQEYKRKESNDKPNTENHDDNEGTTDGNNA